MKKIFHFDFPQGDYHCDGAVVCCFDHRFDLGFRKFLKRIGITNPDQIEIAGGAKCLASPESQAQREFVVDQIRKSVRLHGTTRVILMTHSDCGAYGGLAGKFGGDRRAELVYHRGELHQAKDALTSAIPGLNVDAYFVDFEGVWQEDV